MMTRINNTPDNMVGFIATGNVIKEDYQNIVYPAVNKVIEKTGHLNYLMLLDTTLDNFTLGALEKDIMLGISKITRWHRCAIVSDSRSIRLLTDMISPVFPGEFKGFEKNELENAILWVSDKHH